MAIFFSKRQKEDLGESPLNCNSGSVVKEVTKSAVCALLKEPLFFEFASIRMDRKNYGAPPEDSGIHIVTDGRPFIDDVPECAENPHYQGEWKYNFPGVIQLMKKLGRKLPSTEQMIRFMKAIPGDSTMKMHMINAGIFPGYRDADDGIVSYRGYVTVWWTIGPLGYIEHVLLGQNDQDPKMDRSYRFSGFSVRFLFEEK